MEMNLENFCSVSIRSLNWDFSSSVCQNGPSTNFFNAFLPAFILYYGQLVRCNVSTDRHLPTVCSHSRISVEGQARQHRLPLSIY